MSKRHRAAVQEQLATLGAIWALPGGWMLDAGRCPHLWKSAWGVEG